MAILRLGSLAATGLLLFGFGCEPGSSAEERLAKLRGAADCETDKNCGKGFVCTELKCVKGERTEAEKLAQEKAEEKIRMDAIAAKKVVKPGEGRLYVRICPVFKNTPEALGTITAKNQKTKKETFLHLAMVVPDGQWQDVFTFHSLPLGTYDVSVTYGIQSRGRPDVVKIKCDPKAKPCRDEFVREIEVVLPKDEAPVKIDKTTKKVIKIKCDFQAE